MAASRRSSVVPGIPASRAIVNGTRTDKEFDFVEAINRAYEQTLLALLQSPMGAGDVDTARVRLADLQLRTKTGPIPSQNSLGNNRSSARLLSDVSTANADKLLADLDYGLQKKEHWLVCGLYCRLRDHPGCSTLVIRSIFSSLEIISSYFD